MTYGELIKELKYLVATLEHDHQPGENITNYSFRMDLPTKLEKIFDYFAFEDSK